MCRLNKFVLCRLIFAHVTKCRDVNKKTKAISKGVGFYIKANHVYISCGGEGMITDKNAHSIYIMIELSIEYVKNANPKIQTMRTDHGKNRGNNYIDMLVHGSMDKLQ